MTSDARRAWRALVRQVEAETGQSAFEYFTALLRADALMRERPLLFAWSAAAQFAREQPGALGRREEFLAHVLAGLGLPLDGRLAEVVTRRASELVAAARLQATADQAAIEADQAATNSLENFAASRPRFDELRPEIRRLMAEADRAGVELSLEAAYQLALIEDAPDVQAPIVVAA